LDIAFQAIHGISKGLNAVILFKNEILLLHVLFGYAGEGKLKLSDPLLTLLYY
jgi:hypothetical protein